MESQSQRPVSGRKMNNGSAWDVPVIALVGTTPAFATSYAYTMDRVTATNPTMIATNPRPGSKIELAMLSVANTAKLSATNRTVGDRIYRGGVAST